MSGYDTHARTVYQLLPDPSRDSQHIRGRRGDDHGRFPSVQQPASDGPVRDRCAEGGCQADQPVPCRQEDGVRSRSEIRRFGFQVEGHGGAQQDPLRRGAHLQADRRSDRLSQLDACCRNCMQGEPAPDTGPMPPRHTVDRRIWQLFGWSIIKEEAPEPGGSAP